MSTARRTISSAIKYDPPGVTLQLVERYERPMKAAAAVAARQQRHADHRQLSGARSR